MQAVNTIQRKSRRAKFPSSIQPCVAQDMTIRIKNGVAVLTGVSSSKNISRETAAAMSRVNGVDRVIDLVNITC